MASIIVMDKTAVEEPKKARKGSILDLETVDAPELDKPAKEEESVDHKMRTKLDNMCADDFSRGNQKWTDELEKMWAENPEYWEECRRKYLESKMSK